MAGPAGSRRNSRCAAAARGQSVPTRPAPAVIASALPVAGAPSWQASSSEALEQPQLEGPGEQLVPGVDTDLEGVLAAVVWRGSQLVEARAVRVGRAGGAQRLAPDVIGAIRGPVGGEQ